MNFEKDIYINYAHIDDESVSEGTKGWVTEFHKAIEVRLGQILGREPKIWRDVKLQGNDFFAFEIESQFPKLKIMVCIVTPRFVQSSWCIKDLEMFYEAAQQTGGVTVENRSRIFKILKTPVPIEDQPDILKPFLGYEFYRMDAESKQVREYGMKKEGDYWYTISDVAYDIADLLEKLN